MADLRGRDRLIVALDVPTTDDALALAGKLESEVGFFKIGWQLFMTGDVPILLERLQEKKLFVDLKVPGDIGNTIRAVVDLCAKKGVRFLTLSDSVPLAAIASAKAARGTGPYPKLLMVPLLSSLDASDLESITGSGNLDQHIITRSTAALGAGCDGLIASGDAIGVLRRQHGAEVLIVSPGIRPSGMGADDHKRFTTPAEAIGFGADYVVVGRPIRNAADPLDAARRIIDEIDRELDRNRSTGSSRGDSPIQAMYVKGQD